MTNESTEAVQGGCPEWCDSCQIGLGGEHHFSDTQEIPLSLERPVEYLDPDCNEPGWVPSVLEVYTQQLDGAYWPVIRIGRQGATEAETLRLTPIELIELVGILTEIRDGIRRRSHEAADRAAKAREAQAVPA